MKPTSHPLLRALLWFAAIVLSGVCAHAQTAVFRINSGGAAVSPYSADSNFNTGNTFSAANTINLTGVTNPAPAAVYQSVRWAPSFNYTLGGLTAGGSYLVRLHFVELSFGAAGQRTFNAAINGTSILSNFDIFASAGGQNRALVREFNATANASGQVIVAFTQGTADNPSLAGLELYTATAGTQTPYNGVIGSIANGSTIQAEHYDNGGQGIAYNDTTAGNTGGVLRSDGVDLETTTDTGGGANVGWTINGEWLEYTANSSAGTYNIVVRAASGSTATKSLRVLLDGTVLGTATIPSTGGWQTWQDFTISGVPITTGTNRILRLEIVGGDFNLNYVRFSTTTAQPPAAPTGLAASAGNAQVALSWTASSGATSYNVYRGTSAGGEGTTPIQTGVTATTFTNTGLTNGTTYYYKVAAVNAAGTSAQSNEASATPSTGAPATPTGLTASGGNAQVALSWTASSGATSYNIYRGTSANGEGTTPIQTGVTATTFTNTGLTNGTTYYYKVAAVNASGPSAQSNEASATPSTGAPATPTGLTASAGNAQVALSWTASSGATSYNIYRGTSSNGQGTTPIQTGVTGTSFTNTGLTNGTTYYYKVAAVNSSGTSAQSSEASATPTGGSNPPNTPIHQVNAGGGAVSPFVADTGFSGGNQFSSGATINTSGVANAAPAAVYQDVRWNPSFTYTLGGLTSGTSYVVRLHFVELSFTAAGQRLFNVALNGTSVLSAFDIFAAVGQNRALVREFNATANGSGQIVISFTAGAADNPSIAGIQILTQPALPSAPTGLAATAGNGSVGLSWNAASGAATYNVYRGTSANGESATPVATGVAATNYTDNTVTNGTTYFYKVAAVNSAGTSAQSNEASALPHVMPPAAPASLSASGGFGSISLAWSAVSGAATYNVYRGTSSNGEGSTPYASGIAATTYSDGNVTPGTAYFYKVAAVNSAGTSAQSVEATATPLSTAGRGAAMPYRRYESEDGTRAGSAALRTTPTFDYTQIAAEASSQAYVALPGNGASVEWTIASGGGGAGVTMRFTMPDTANGMGQSGSLDCYVNNVKVQTIALSSFWAWQYFAIGSDQPQDAPNGGIATFKFDEVHWKLATALVAGDKIRIQSSGAGGLEYGVDFLEIEPVPAAIPAPANSLSVIAYGATANDSTDDLPAFTACVNAAVTQGKSVYIPAGNFNLGSMWIVGTVASPIAGNFTITGAGMWHTNLQFTNPNVSGGGISFRMAQTGKLDFGHVYMNSMLRTRYNQNAIYKAFMDNFGANSRIHDFWEEHFECGFWVGDYAHTPVWVADNLLIENGRIRNNLADGANFCQGTKNSTVQNCSVRNNGDDGLAVWPDQTNGAPMGINNTFSHNTVENNWRAGGIAFFGGSGHKAQYNLIKDCFMGSALRMNTVFPGYHFENNTGILFSDTTIIACGTSQDVYNGERGAIDLEASNSSIKNVTFTNIDIIDTQRDAIQFGYGGGFTNVVFNQVTIDGTGLDAVTSSRFSSPHNGTAIYTYTGNGSATFNGLTLSNIEATPPNLIQSGFVLIVQ